MRQITSSVWETSTHPDARLIPGVYLAPSMSVRGKIDSIAAVEALRGGVVLPPHTTYRPHQSVFLRPYQESGVGRMLALCRSFGGVLLADDMGLGKTRQAIVAATQLGQRTLVIAPASVRESWREELTRLGQHAVAILGPPSSKRYATAWAAMPTAQWVVVSYELAERVTDVFDTLILDEAHRVKGRSYAKSGNKQAQTVESIARTCNYRIAMTGTPVMDRPRDLWRILHILFGGAFGSSWAFDHRYCGAHLNEWGGLENTGATNTDELRLRLSYLMIRRSKQEVAAELPAVTRQILWLESSERGAKAFQRAMLFHKPGYVQKALEATLEAKMPVAIELAVAAKSFLLVTYKRVHARQMADKISRQVPCYCITGEDSHEQRNAIIKAAAASGAGIVATADSIGTGVDGLQHVASYGIMHALDWGGEKMAQVEGRLHRIGQKLPVTWVYLAEMESMDAIVAKTAIAKLDQAHAILGGSRDQRNTLSDHIDGAGAADAEAAALRAIYAAMSEGETNAGGEASP